MRPEQILTSGLSGILSSYLSLHKSGNSKRSKHLELVVFDADGTLTMVTSIWQYLHQQLGTWNQGRSTALRYWRGEITYDEWARLDAMMWRGKKLREIAGIIERISYIDGVNDTFNTLRNRGMKIAVASAGLSILVDRIVRELGADYSVANELAVEDGRLTGDIEIKVSLSNKCQVIRQIARSFHIDMEACAVIGDYSYDIPDDAGVKVAFNPKDDKVEKLADVVLRSSNLRDVLKHLI